jgi:hypothetical protein
MNSLSCFALLCVIDSNVYIDACACELPCACVKLFDVFISVNCTCKLTTKNFRILFVTCRIKELMFSNFFFFHLLFFNLTASLRNNRPDARFLRNFCRLYCLCCNCLFPRQLVHINYKIKIILPL